MLRMFAVSLLMSGSLLMAADPKPAKLVAPDDWTGETIAIPPGFAPDMKLKGTEHIRFAPGMMKPAADTFFSYAFVFELEPQSALTEGVVKEEFLKYYRGLCQAVLGGKVPDVDPSNSRWNCNESNPTPSPPHTPARWIGSNRSLPRRRRN